MKKVTRLALYGAGALVAFLVVAFLAVNLYVQSRGTQARIEQELSERLGTPLQIRRISVTPWWGLKLTGITIPQADATVPGNFLRADAFRLRVRLASLFSRRLVIKEISLMRPEVIWAQNADGKWRLPMTLLEQRPQATNAAPAASGMPAEPNATLPSSTATAPEPTGTDATKPFQPEVRRVNLRDGDFHFLDAKKEPVATFEGVGFRSNFRSATALTGNASITRTSLRDRFFLKNLRSPLSYDPTQLDFSAITAEAADGEILGRFTMQPNDPESPFTVMVKFRALEANRILADAHGPEGMVQGKLEGHLDATGQIADPNALSGAGEIILREGQVRRYSLLVALGQMLQIEELMQLRLDQAHVRYRIAPGVVTVDELLLASANLRLSATGTISFEGALQLEAKLAINERIRQQLFRAVRENFQPTGVPGYSAVAFQVTGTVDSPKTNLMDKVVGEELRDLGGVINRLLGRGRSRSKKVQRAAPPPTEATPVPAPTPEPTSSP